VVDARTTPSYATWWAQSRHVQLLPLDVDTFVEEEEDEEDWEEYVMEEVEIQEEGNGVRRDGGGEGGDDGVVEEVAP